MTTATLSIYLYNVLNHYLCQCSELWRDVRHISQEIVYESMVNLRPRQNQSMQILNPDVRKSVHKRMRL